MKKKNKIFLYGFLLVALVVGLWISFNYDQVNNFINREIGNYGYVGLFVSSVLIDMLVQPLGPEVPGFIGLIFGFNFFLVFLVIVCGSMVGSLASYYIGKRFLSGKVLDAYRGERYREYCEFFRKYGKVSLLIAAVTPVPYVFLCWMSGAFFMKLKDFTIYGLIPRIFRIGAVLVIIGGIV